MTYEAVREFAGSWMLLFMFLFFSGVILWTFRPGSGREHRDTANMIFRNDDAPEPGASGDGADESRKEARS
jgi:cytochrome c oxidase cbb3-type subunit 4